MQSHPDRLRRGHRRDVPRQVCAGVERHRRGAVVVVVVVIVVGEADAPRRGEQAALQEHGGELDAATGSGDGASTNSARSQ